MGILLAPFWHLHSPHMAVAGFRRRSQVVSSGLPPNCWSLNHNLKCVCWKILFKSMVNIVDVWSHKVATDFRSTVGGWDDDLPALVSHGSNGKSPSRWKAWDPWENLKPTGQVLQCQKPTNLLRIGCTSHPDVPAFPTFTNFFKLNRYSAIHIFGYFFCQPSANFWQDQPSPGPF